MDDVGKVEGRWSLISPPFPCEVENTSLCLTSQVNSWLQLITTAVAMTCATISTELWQMKKDEKEQEEAEGRTSIGEENKK